MAAENYYSFLARTQIERLEANRAQALADLQAAKANSDYDSAGAAVQELADIEAKKANIVALHDQYVASQTPVQPPELSQEEKAAKPISAMDYNDVWEMSATSKYGVDEDAFRAGMAEVGRRKMRGE